MERVSGRQGCLLRGKCGLGQAGADGTPKAHHRAALLAPCLGTQCSMSPLIQKTLLLLFVAPKLRTHLLLAYGDVEDSLGTHSTPDPSAHPLPLTLRPPSLSPSPFSHLRAPFCHFVAFSLLAASNTTPAPAPRANRSSQITSSF